MATIDELIAQGAPTPDEGALESFLRYLGRGGYAVRNVLTGNLQGAGRQLVDILGDTADAFLPGDLIPELSRRSQGEGTPNDYTEGSDLLGGMEPGLGKLAADIGIGMLTDPLTYLGVGVGANAAKGAVAAEKALAAGATTNTARKGLTVGIPFMDSTRRLIPGTEPLVEAVGKGAQTAYGALPAPIRGGLEATAKGAKSVLGMTNPAPWAKALLEKVRNTGGQTAAAQEEALRPLLASLTPEQGQALFRAIQGYKVGPEGAAEVLGQLPRNPLYEGTDEALRVGAENAKAAGQRASEVWPELIPPGEREGALTELDRALGLRGVAGDDEVNQLIAEIRNQVAPPVPTPSKYASGVELANQPLMGGPVRRVDQGTLIGGAGRAAEEVIPSAAARETNDVLQTQRSLEIDPVSKMLGAPNRPAISRSGTEIAKPLDVANLRQGGLIPEAVKVGADDLPEVFSVWKPYEQQVADIVDALRQAGYQGEELATLSKAAQDWVDYTGTMFRESAKRGTFAIPQGRDLLRESPQYAPRMWTQPEGALEQQLAQRAGVAPNAAKARTYREPKDVVDAINRGEKLNEDLAKVATQRAGQESQMAGRTVAAKGMVDEFARRAEEKLARGANEIDQFHYLPEAERYAKAGLTAAEQEALAARWSPLYQAEGKSTDLAKAANAILDELKSGPLADPETAQALEAAYRGLPPRQGIMKILNGANHLFKPYATAGAFLPRLNFSIRNVTTGGTLQVLANKQARPAMGAYLKSLPKTIIRSMDDGLEALTGTRLLRSENEFAAANAALKASKGSVPDAIALMPPGEVREAFEDGVILGGFIDAEKLGRQLGTKGWKKWITDLRDWPAEIAKGSEQRIRFAVYKALREQGMDRAEAARTVLDTFFDYGYTSVANRAARDVIPFFQFTAKSIPQTLKLLREQPSVAGAIRPFYTQDSPEHPIPPWMQRQAVVPFGEDEQGNPQYLSGFGFPFESLATLPNPSDDLGDFLAQVRQGVLGQANPGIKTAVGALSGVDPYFGTPFMSYDKTPELFQALGAPERGELGRIYNALAATGAIQPLSSPVGYLSGFLDERKSAPEAALSGLTGAQVRSVDEDQAIQQQIQDILRRNPRVSQYVSYYQTQPDEETQALIGQLNAAKKRLKAKRQAQ